VSGVRPAAEPPSSGRVSGGCLLQLNHHHLRGARWCVGGWGGSLRSRQRRGAGVKAGVVAGRRVGGVREWRNVPAGGWGWFWGHRLYVGVTRPTNPARYVRVWHRGSDPNVGAVTRKARCWPKPGSPSGQGVTRSCRFVRFALVLVYRKCPGVPKVTPVRPSPASRTVSALPTRYAGPGTVPGPGLAPLLWLARERSEQQQQATGVSSGIGGAM
jgi:hypothetical protein